MRFRQSTNSASWRAGHRTPGFAWRCPGSTRDRRRPRSAMTALMRTPPARSSLLPMVKGLRFRKGPWLGCVNPDWYCSDVCARDVWSCRLTGRGAGWLCQSRHSRAAGGRGRSSPGRARPGWRAVGGPGGWRWPAGQGPRWRDGRVWRRRFPPAEQQPRSGPQYGPGDVLWYRHSSSRDFVFWVRHNWSDEGGEYNAVEVLDPGGRPAVWAGDCDDIARVLATTRPREWRRDLGYPAYTITIAMIRL